MDANRLAFSQWKIVPRMLRPTTHRNLRTTLFGQKLDSPICIAPIGVQTIFHPDKETGVASIANELGLPYVLSTASNSSFEEVAYANGEGGLRCPHADPVPKLLNRAKNNGYTVLLVTLDTWTLGFRPADLENAYFPFATGTGYQVGLSDPIFRAKFAEDHPGKTSQTDLHHRMLASKKWEQDVFSGAAHTWEQLELLKKHWDGPIVLKGIQSVEDAKMAVEAGMAGIVVSNHGGRQLDGAIGSLEVLPEIAEAVGDKLTILFDSGIRTGADVIKALSLGAKGVLVGRPWVYGLAMNGKDGAKSVLQYLLADLDQSMALAGIQNIERFNRDVIRKVQYPGDRMSNL